jgi:hypothetical protein
MSSTVKYGRPEDAPAVKRAADGHTQLQGYKVEAVVYATDQAAAEGLVAGSYTRCVLDHARVTGPVPPAAEKHLPVDGLAARVAKLARNAIYPTWDLSVGLMEHDGDGNTRFEVGRRTQRGHDWVTVKVEQS